MCSMQLAPRPVRLGEKYIFQNFLTWEVLFLKCFVNSQFKCKPKDLLSTSYNWLQSQQGCHVGNGIYVFVSVSLNKIGAWAWVVGATVSLSSWNLFAHNEGVLLKKSYLWESVLQWIYQRVTYSIKIKGSAISDQEVFNSIHMEELMWTRTVALTLRD